MKKHRGEVVEEAVRKSGFSIKKLAERLKISRNTLYNRFKEPELSYEFVAAVGNIIHYNFAIDLPEIESEINKAGENPITYVERDTVALLKLEKKYTGLLERYNELLGILIKLANANEMGTLQKEIRHFLDTDLD